MPRLNASQNQSYVLGGDKSSGSDLPRFERPVLKQAKSAHSRTTSPRNTPKSTLSSGFFRGRSAGGDLPLTSSPNNSFHSNSKSRNKVRAAVSGRDTSNQGLPDWSRTAVSPSNSFNSHLHHHQHHPHHSHSSPNPRVRTTSQDVYSSHSTHAMGGSLREHPYDYHSDEDHNVKQRRSSTNTPSATSVGGSTSASNTPHQHVLRQRPPRQPNRSTPSHTHSGTGSTDESPYRPSSFKRHSKFMKTSNAWWRACYRWNLTQILQVTVAALVTFLLYDGHHKANLIASRLKEFKSEENMLFLHLHHIEQHSIQLHEELQRLDLNGGADPEQPQTDDQEYLPDAKHNPNNNIIDSALIQKQTQQLMQMEEELSHEVRTLQTRIQHSAVRSIVHEYGEGPVQVTWEVVVDGQTSKISILLWHDTPHAAWTWLEQISQKQWDGAQIFLENSRILGAGSIHGDVSHEARLDFIERSQQRHEAWTVGLTDATHDDHGGGLQVFINLQDNTEFSKHNVCIGKVFDGFDVLHKMVEQTRQMQQVAGGQQPPPHPITIQTARASHLTNRETKGLI